MSSIYARKQTTVQKQNAPKVASVFDLSSQGASLQRKAGFVNENSFCDFSTNYSLIQREKSEHQIQDQRTNKGVLYSLDSDRLPFEEYVVKVSNALERAVMALYSVINALNGMGNNPVLENAFSFCFGYNSLSYRGKVIGKYQKTLNGLIKNKNDFIDLAEDEVPQRYDDPQGYVNTIMGIAFGGIHINFSLEEDDLTKLIIHESTHFYAGTVDNGYFELSDVFGALNMQAGLALDGLVMNIPPVVVNGLNNADSYANFAMFCAS